MSITSRRDIIANTLRSGGKFGQSALLPRLIDLFNLIAVRDAPAPAAFVADATLTIADLLTEIITSTKASAVALTLPTGTLTDAGVTLDIGQAFDWSVINLGSSTGAVTMTAGTDHTYVGNAVVAISTSARFRTRKTAALTFVTYRIS